MRIFADYNKRRRNQCFGVEMGVYSDVRGRPRRVVVRIVIVTYTLIQKHTRKKILILIRKVI